MHFLTVVTLTANIALLLQTSFAADCTNTDGTELMLESCRCGRIDCAENQFCKVGDTLDESTIINSARPDGTVFFGVNGQCSDISAGPWYVGIINGLCEDVPGRHTITSLKSCQDAFATGVLASSGTKGRFGDRLTPSWFGCNTHGDCGSCHQDNCVARECECEDLTYSYLGKVSPNMCCGNVSPNMATNERKGCTLDRYTGSKTPFYYPEYAKLGAYSPAGDPVAGYWAGPRFTICISAPVCGNIVSLKFKTKTNKQQKQQHKRRV